MNTVETGELRDLLRALLRARAFEALCHELPGVPLYPPGDRRSVMPALPAAAALRRRADGTGDLFSMRCGSPAAALLFGLDAATLFRQVLARSTAPAQGRDPAGFPTDLPRGLLAPVPAPGTLVEVFAGVALAFRLRRDDRVALLVDDARGAESGFWHEGLNLAAVNRAPLVLVVDATARKGHAPSFVERAPAYGVQAHAATARDPVGLMSVVRAAVDAARTGQGTQLVEVTEPTSDEEVVATLAGRLRWTDAVPDAEAAGWQQLAVTEMEEALETVLTEPAPDPDEARAFVHSS